VVVKIVGAFFGNGGDRHLGSWLTGNKHAVWVVPSEASIPDLEQRSTRHDSITCL
jgi:hypothetical protein